MSELTLAVVVVFALVALFEHFWSEEGIVNLASEAAGDDAKFPLVWVLGMLSFPVGFYLSLPPTVRLDLYVSFSSIAVVSLLADMTNTDRRWERITGIATVFSIVVATIASIRLEQTEPAGYSAELNFWAFVVAGYVQVSLVLIAVYIFKRSRYFD